MNYPRTKTGNTRSGAAAVDGWVSASSTRLRSRRARSRSHSACHCCVVQFILFRPFAARKVRC